MLCNTYEDIKLSDDSLTNAESDFFVPTHWNPFIFFDKLWICEARIDLEDSEIEG